MPDNTVPKKVSASETGHAKNAANFGAMISACASLGASYNPTNPFLALPAMKDKKTKLDNGLAAVAGCEADYKVAVNARQEDFDNLGKLATRVINALAVVGTAREIADARGIVKKLSSVKKLKAEDPAVAVKSKSTSQRSYDNRIANFRDLTALLAKIPAYKPNETDLQVASLNAYLNALSARGEAVNVAADALNKARNTRDVLLYAKGAGAFDVGMTVKKYVKSVFGSGSKEYKLVSKIEFKKR